MIRVAIIVAVLAALCSAQDSNRLWLGRAELEGPFERVIFDCGPAGRTTWDAPALRGERKTVQVPLPLICPLGMRGLGAMPPPEITVDGKGDARWLGLEETQPETRWESLAIGLRARPRPPVGRVAAWPSRAALLLALATGITGLLLVGRRVATRALRGLLLAAGAAGTLALGLRTGPPPSATTVLEADADSSTWTRVMAAASPAALAPGDAGLARLEVTPGRGYLEYLGSGAGSAGWEASLEGGSIVLVHLEQGAAWEGTAQPAWWRDEAGAWQRHGRLEQGQGALEAGEDPPGWLRAGLAPGRSVLLGGLDGDPGSWIRHTGYPRPQAGD